MKTGKASGLQIAFFTFAVVILATAAVAYVSKAYGVTDRVLLARTMILIPALVLFLAIAPLRRSAMALLRVSVPPERIPETWVVAIATSLLSGLATAGGMALWYSASGGPEALEAWARQHGNHDQAMARSLSLSGMLALSLAVLLAPLLEELVFRGYLYRAWEERWGWVPAMLASSLLFALYHTHVVATFASALVYTALYRRTGSLWAPILVHALNNLVFWYPLMGRLMFPQPSPVARGLEAWTLQVAAFFVTLGAMAVYLGLARKAYASRLPVAG